MNFTIKKNKHYANFWFGITFKKKISYECTLTDSCLYTIAGVDSYDINKLVGFSTAINHHNQSARFGWRCRDGKTFELLPYTYSNHQRDTVDTILGVVLPETKFRVSIEDCGTSYLYTFKQGDTVTTAEKSKQPDKLWFKWLLKFYFGGNNPAPHEMTAMVNRIVQL